MAFRPATNHKSPGIDATPRGPARWERAARNALLRPHSKAAVIYRERYNLALEISQAQLMLNKGSDRPWSFVGRTGRWVPDGTKWVAVRGRKYACCSTFCTVLQATLDLQDTSTARIADAFTKTVDAHSYELTLEPLDVKTLRAGGVKCQVCGTRIKKK
jgi:hypothetical protein